MARTTESLDLTELLQVLTGFGEGRGTIIYLILEDQQIVDVLEILWV